MLGFGLTPIWGLLAIPRCSEGEPIRNIGYADVTGCRYFAVFHANA